MNPVYHAHLPNPVDALRTFLPEHACLTLGQDQIQGHR